MCDTLAARRSTKRAKPKPRLRGAHKPRSMRASHAQVLELVDKLDLGSSAL